MQARTPEMVVVTGASAGVGRAIVRDFARRGASIGLVAHGHEGLEGARRDVEELGGRALVLPTDVAKAEQVEAAAAKVEESFGPIDIWINDAMTAVFSQAWEMTPEEFRRITEVTYLGTVYGTLAALRRMLPSGSGADHPDRLRSGLSRHSPAIRLLWGQACHPGLHGVRTCWVDPQEKQGHDHDGPTPGVSFTERHLDVVVFEHTSRSQLARLMRFSLSPGHHSPDKQRWQARSPDLLPAELTYLPGIHLFQARSVTVFTENKPQQSSILLMSS